MGSRRVGIDLGGTKVLGVLLDDDDVAAQVKQKTPADGGPEAVVDVIAAVVDELGGHGLPVGVGAPGVVQADTGVVSRAPNLPGWDKPFGLGAALRDRLGVEVRVDNDVNVAAVAEHDRGAGRGVDDLLVLMVGTGVGSALVLDGRVRRGPHGIAGEIGHVVVHAGGRRCGCGGLGHLEAYAGRAGLEAEARRRAAAGTATKLVEVAGEKRMTSSVFDKALAARDALTVRLLDDAVDALGIAISAAAAIVDLSLVVVGGGLAERLGPAFVGRVEQAVRTNLFASTPLAVVPSALGDLAGAVGAALSAPG